MLLTTAFEAEQGKASILTETPNNGFFMLRVDGITESRVKDFEEVRDQVSIDWMADRVDAELEALAETVVSRLEGGEAISAVAAELGVPVNRSQPFLRDTGDASANIGPSLAAQLFGIETGKAVSAPSDSGLTIAVLTEIRPAEDDAEKKKALAGQLDGQLRIDVVDELTRALRDRFGETVNREMIGELF
jgi:peptidyl-prolyl cis-trans isomerase D